MDVDTAFSWDELAAELVRLRAEVEMRESIVRAARDWTTDRNPTDHDSKVLFVAVYRAFPDDLGYKENCTCGNADECDECPTKAQTEAALASLEQEIARAALAPAGKGE